MCFVFYPHVYVCCVHKVRQLGGSECPLQLTQLFPASSGQLSWAGSAPPGCLAGLLVSQATAYLRLSAVFTADILWGGRGQVNLAGLFMRFDIVSMDIISQTGLEW